MIPQITHIVASAARAVTLMREGDTFGELDQLVRREKEAEELFRKIAYRAWPSFPDHPAGPALASFADYLGGGQVDPARFVGLAWVGQLLESHRDDWTGWESLMGGRLRSAENFRPWLFELEASDLLRRAGHRTRWLSPIRLDDVDLVIDGGIQGECVHGNAIAGLRVPHRHAAQLASGLVAAMTKARRNLHVDVVVSDNLRGADIPRLAAELAKAISEAGVGSIPLSLAGYAAIIAVLSEGDAPLTDTQVKEIQGRFGQHRHTWGHVEQSRQGHALRPRIVSISAEQRDSMVIATARTAAAKHAQLTANRPGIVCVKFGLPVSLEQATNPSLQSAIAAIVRQTLAQEGAHRVSAVLWVMETTVVFPNHGRGLVDPDPDAGDPQQGVILIRNPQASSPLSSDFGI